MSRTVSIPTAMDPKTANIVRYMQNHPGKTPNQVRRSLTRFGVLASDVTAAAAQCGYVFAPAPSSAPPVHTQPAAAFTPGGGITLDGQRLMSHKPADSAKVHLLRLPKGQAFVITDLATRVGVSPETLRRHAKALKCLLYLEVSPGDWQQVVLNPETAQEYGQD